MAQDKPTLCWKCEKACGGCSWSADFDPVKGWTAKRTIIKGDTNENCHRDIESYIVFKCPLFKDDSEKYKPKNGIALQIPQNRKRFGGTKSQLRKKIESLPHDELERLIQTTVNFKEIARMAFIEKMTSTEISNALHLNKDNIKKRICNMVHQIAEANA